jgi:hypothetical protein
LGVGESLTGAFFQVVVDQNTDKIQITYDGGTMTGFKIEFYTGRNGTTDNSSKRLQAEKIWGTTRTAITDDPPAVPQIGGNSYITSYTSTYPIYIWGPEYLSLVSSTFQNIITRRNSDIVYGQSNIIMRIPIQVPPMSQAVYIDTNEATTSNSQRMPGTLSIGLIDETGNYLNFNNGQCHLQLIVSQV